MIGTFISVIVYMLQKLAESMSLEKVEKDRLDKLNAVGEAPEMLDEHLSYAIALEVKEAWGDHLAQTFMATTVMR